MAQAQLLNIGDNVAHYGKVAAILWIGGERYYMLTSRKGVVSLMPASAVEPRNDDDMGTYFDNFQDGRGW